MGIFDRLRRRSGPDRFAGEVLAALRAAGITDTHYDRDEFSIEYRRGPGTEPAWLYLHNLYAECQREPRTRDERIRRFVATFTRLPEVPDSWESARDRLRPVLRSATFARGGESGRPAALRRPAFPFLDEMVVVDQPSSMAYVSEMTCAEWGVSSEEVFATARANLAATAGLPPAEQPAGRVMLRFIDDGDAYWVSHLLLDGWLAALGEHVGGAPLAFMPDVRSLIVIDADPEPLPELFDLIERHFAESPRPLSPVAYTVDQAGRVVPFTVASGHPAAAAVQRASRVLAASEYGAQQNILRHEVEEYVASYAVFGTSEGGTFSVASWTRGMHVLLPRVDFVAFNVAAGSTFFVPWDVVMEADVLTELPEYRPSRYRGDSWPAPAAFGYLRERAVPIDLGRSVPR
ncbi:hypothetical protein HC028_18585 [Planosporangium flavigriseum]|uniref:DUF1444 domain-containing protein n=1 Tax=Planosporangium flavigriseum TaxID=373681 RepID=A0A8J3LNF7_9ACTN|nr:hypothetical protein [Planosporangium flavigriseum]NJC66496.1 hypothetical protein [Planosporangium flavigriseum]GIG76373.1 hypothetical protein Pfl04_47770 [Planosporangium flavigriseum]